MQTCNECFETKSFDLFYTNKGMPSGYLKQCKECIKKKQAVYKKTDAGRLQVKKNRKQYNDSKQKYKVSEKGKLASSKYVKAKDRQAAMNAVKYAVRVGKLIRQPCWICGEKGFAHHSSYLPEMRLFVTWLCTHHHNQLHIEHDGKKIWTNHELAK